MTSVVSTPSALPVSGGRAATPSLLIGQLIAGQVNSGQVNSGQVISGLVVALLDDSTLRLQTPAGMLDVKADTPLPVGTPVALAAQGTPAQPNLVLTPVPGAAAQPDAPSPQSSTPQSVTTAATDRSGPPQTARVSAPLMQAALETASAIVRDAAASQGGLATLYANLETLVAEATPGTPRPVMAAAKQLLSLRFDTGPGDTIDADAIKTALLRSGLATEFTGAAGSADTGAGDIGTALAVLRQALKNWLDLDPSTKAPSAPFAAPTGPRAAPPMPPYRGAPTVAQAPAASSIATAAPREQATQLLAQTNAAIARQTLLHIASLPGGQPTDPTHDQTPSARLMFDIPIATAQGTGVAQMTIERDGGHRGGGQPEDPVWRANFSVNLEPIGPVHIRIALAGARTTVTMNAERAPSAAVLSAQLPLLEAGLRDNALEPGELRCHAAPSRPTAAAPGLFLDQAT